MPDHSIGILDGEEPGSIGIESDRCERDHSLLTGDPIMVAKREPAFSKFGIPADAVKQVLKGLH